MRHEGDDIFEGLGSPEGEAGALAPGGGKGRAPADAGGASGTGNADVDGVIPDALVDQFFDNELDENARREFLRALPGDLDRCEDVARTRRMLDMFKAAPGTASVAGPDLTGRIIASVDRKRGFASRHVRRVARVARLAIAASVVLVVGAVATVDRVAPDATRLAPAPAPLTSALRESQAELASTLGSLTTTVDTIQQRVVYGLHMDPGSHQHADGQHAAVTHGPVTHGMVWHIEFEHEGDSHEPGLDGAHRHAGHQVLMLANVERAAQRGTAYRGTGQRGIDRAPSSRAAAGRAIAVSFSLSAKSRPGSMVWTSDMAPPVATANGQSGWVGLVDAEGRCAAFNTPMGICRQGDAPGPYVLPGRAVEVSGFRAGVMPSLGGSIRP